MAKLLTEAQARRFPLVAARRLFAYTRALAYHAALTLDKPKRLG